jgi:hypothetical protein
VLFQPASDHAGSSRKRTKSASCSSCSGLLEGSRVPNDTSGVVCDQLAPVRLRTAGTVLVMIQKSVDSDHVSMYSTSSFTQSAKPISFRP